MNRITTPLLLMLLIQGVITAAVYWPRQPTVLADAVDGSLLSLEPAAITRIHIADDSGSEALLQRVDDGWRLPGLMNLPADPGQVQRLLQALTQQQAGFPVATSVAARQRFEVTSYLFQRQLTLLQDDTAVATVYLGTAPGYRKVHAREASENAIYRLDFNNFDAPAESSGWLDRRLLQIPAPRAITGPGFSLRRSGDDNWKSATGARPEARELEALLVSLRNLQVEGLAGEDEQRSLAASGPVFELDVVTDEEELKLAFFTLEQDYYLHDSRHELFFAISGYDFDRLNSLDAARLQGGSEMQPAPGHNGTTPEQDEKR
ncbi:DUF4340 domain-containing protein [Kineobactrum salinum]|uniref:DUF4340 domain-containing protein n=1 Tax=Kineobactrum salinum TaxID=2708301 RepID=A0A6C0U4W1_9GAMM|nr:DUF4340 domain-containing protein [Kineobactrum salinum]QIB65435.1 DUF4340 domain-containing protein [Kineobactrum salinum]